MDVSPRLQQISPSLTLAIASKAKSLKRQGVDIISLAAGEPDFDTPGHIKAAAREAIDKGRTKYTAARGMPELIEAVRDKFKRENELDYSADEIVISCGAKHSLYNAFQAICREGDEVIIPAPYWVTYPEQVKLAGAEPVILETREEDRYRIDPERLAALVTPRTRALVVSSPANPTGAGYPRSDLEFIAETALKNDFYLVSDEVYEKLVFDDFRPISVASLSREARARTIVINGVSKSYAMTGWRIGYLAAPGNVAGAISGFQSHSTSNPATVSQYAALAALRGDQTCVEEMRRVFEERRNLMMDRLARITGITCFRPSGAFYTFPDVSAFGKRSLDLAGELLEKARVAVVPGIAFGRDANIRVSFADSKERLEEGLNRLESCLKEQIPGS